MSINLTVSKSSGPKIKTAHNCNGVGGAGEML